MYLCPVTVCMVGVFLDTVPYIGVYDLRQHAPVSKPILHSAGITSIVLNDTEGYFVTGYADGEIKVSCYQIRECVALYV